MGGNLPPMGKAIFDDEIAVLDVGSNSDGIEMFYSLWKDSSEGPYRKKWRQPIPSDLSRLDGECYALIKGLRAAGDAGYSMAMITTNSSLITEQLQDDETPYETAFQLLRQFEEVEIHPYAMDL